MSYREKYRSYLVKVIDEVYDSIVEFYNNEYKNFLGRNTFLGTEIAEYTKNEDGLFVLENVNGKDTIGFENVVNLTCLETFTENVFECKPYVIDFVSGRTLTNKKSMLALNKETPMTILDIDFNLISKFVNKMELPQKCFDLSGISKEENILDLSKLSFVDFNKFLSGETELSFLGVYGIKNQCVKSNFNTINLTTVKTFDSSTEPYFLGCNIKSLAISNDTLLNSKSMFCKDCKIDELLIYDNRDIDRNDDKIESYSNFVENHNIASFQTCSINKLTFVSNILLKNTFRSCTISDMEISPRNNDTGIYLEEMCIAYSTFNSRQKLNVARLSESAFYGCVINKEIGNLYKLNYYKPLALYVKDIPDETSVSDAMSAFMDCYGNYEVLDCTVDTVSENTSLFEDNGEVNDDVIYNTLYAMLYRGATHYISLPKEFK